MFKKKKQSKTVRGSTSPQSRATVFSYYANRSPGPEKRSAPGAKVNSTIVNHRLLVLLPSVLATLVITGCVIYATSLDINPRIQMNGNSSNHLLRDQPFYQKAISDVLKKSILNRNKLTIDTNKIAKELEVKYPELGRVTVIVPIASRRPIIELQPSEAVLRLSGSGGSFIVDEQGRALIRANEATSALNDSLPNITDQTGLEIVVGKQILPLNTIVFIREITAQLQAKQVKVQSMSLPPSANELHLKTIGQQYSVKFDTQSDPRQAAGSFLVTKEELQADNIIPSEYIDVRVPEKAFYK